MLLVVILECDRGEIGCSPREKFKLMEQRRRMAEEERI
jgi:hypothetical protein